jgi:hypothetical protein
LKNAPETKARAEQDGRNGLKTHHHKLAVLFLLGGFFARYSSPASASALLKSTAAAERPFRQNAHNEPNDGHPDHSVRQLPDG